MPQMRLDLAVALDAHRQFDGRGLALNVGEDGIDLRDLFADFVFDAADEIVGLSERHRLVDFDVLFDVEFAAYRLDADIMQDYVVARSDRAHLIEDTFSNGLARDHMNDHVGAGDDALHRFGRGANQIFAVLEGEMAGERQSEVGEVGIAGAANARLVHGEHAIDAADPVDHPLAGLGWGGVEQYSDSLLCEVPAKAQD